MAQRLRCESVNHLRCGPVSKDAIITRCVRCKKPTCSSCEGTDDGLRDLCDDCAMEIHDTIDALYKKEAYSLARDLARAWSMRGRYRDVIRDHNLDTPETGYRSRG